MAGESPTTAGSIVGKLSLDKSQWDRQRAEAKGEAAELGATKAEIKVDANVGEALAKLEAVRAAQQKLDFSSQNLRIAYQRLDEAQTKGGASESRLMSLHLAAAKAEAAHEAATRGLANAQQKMAQDSDNAATEVKKLATAVDQVDKATSGGGGGGGGVSRFALIAGAIAALIPLLAPLTGYALGVAGALAGMGAAGVLAIFGIRNAMADGTAVGNQYAAGIDRLKDYFNELANTSAGAALNGFSASIGLIQEAMPALNGQMQLFGTQLGGTTVMVVRAVIDAFRVLNPLFVQAGVYVQQVAAGFQSWVSDGGLQKFAQMAVAALPQVADALGLLLKGALDLTGAFAPLGTVMLFVVGTIGQLLSLISPLVQLLNPLAIAAGAVFGAFKLWQLISPIIDNVRTSIRGLGVDASVAFGVVGIIVGVISALASAMVEQRMQTSAAAKALQDYTAAVQQDNGVIGNSVAIQTKQWAAAADGLGNYTTNGKSAIAVGRELGLSADTITRAALGQNDAVSAVDAAMHKYADNMSNTTAKVAAVRADFNNLVGALSDNRKAIDAQITAYNKLAEQQGLTTISTEGELQAQSALAGAYGMSLSQLLGAEAAQKQSADAAANTTRQLQLENDAVTLLTNAFTLLNKGNLDIAQAQTAAAAATNTLTDSLSQNGVTIDGNSKAAVANQQALQQKALADQAAATAIQQQTGSTEQGTAAFAASRQALIDQLTASHQLTPAIQALIDKYYAVPPVVKTKADLDADAAIGRAQALKGWLDTLTSKTIVVTVQTNAVGAPVGTAAAPGTGNKQYADGGTVIGAGGPKSDSVQAWLSSGEEVTPNPQAGKYRPVLKALASDNLAAASRMLGGTQGGTAVIGGDIRVVVENKTGMNLADLIDVRVERANARTATALRSSKQKVAY